MYYFFVSSLEFGPSKFRFTAQAVYDCESSCPLSSRLFKINRGEEAILMLIFRRSDERSVDLLEIEAERPQWRFWRLTYWWTIKEILRSNQKTVFISV